MLRKTFVFLTSALLAMFFVAAQTSLSNLWWLSSVDMPITGFIIISMLLRDLIGMSVAGAFPIIAVVAAGLLIAFFVAHILSKFISTERKILYALAGGAALFAIVVLMPLAFYNLDLIAGARTSLGKGIIIIGGMIAGCYFGVKSKKVVTNEES
jgi:hypothetical protein